MGLINLLFDAGILLLWIRAVVPNEGHMAFNRPYQSVVQLLAPVQNRFRIQRIQVRSMCLVGILILVGVRGLCWGLAGTNTLDFQVTSPVSYGFLRSQLLSPLAAAVFLLQVYAFLTLAVALGSLDNRTDHYSRLFRALLGPLKQIPPWPRCLVPALALVLLWSVASWALMVLGLLPPNRLGIAGCVLSSIPLTLALILALVNVWIVLLLARAALSFVPIWRPPAVDVIERVTEPVLKPFYRLPFKTDQLDFTPVVAVIALAILHYLLVGGPVFGWGPLLKWMYERV